MKRKKKQEVKGPFREIVFKTVTYTCVATCGHLLGITKKQYETAKRIRCYKCGERKKEKP